MKASVSKLPNVLIENLTRIQAKIGVKEVKEISYDHHNHILYRKFEEVMIRRFSENEMIKLVKRVCRIKS